MKHHHRLLSYAVLALVIGVLLFFYFSFSEELQKFFTPSYVRELLLSSGVLGYGILTLLVAASIPLPIPSAVVVFAGGYVYGIWLGSLLSLVGILLGSSFSFYLTRYLGRPFLESMVDEHHIRHFDHIFKRRGVTAALISYAIPVFPSDALSMFLGITEMKFHVFIFLAFLGHIPRILLTNSLGNDLWAGFSVRTVIVLILTAGFILVTIFREKVKKIFFKELHELEREGEKVEKGAEHEAKLFGKEVEGVEIGIGKKFKRIEKKVEEDVEEVEEEVEEEIEKVEGKNKKKKERK